MGQLKKYFAYVEFREKYSKLSTDDKKILRPHLDKLKEDWLNGFIESKKIKAFDFSGGLLRNDMDKESAGGDWQ